MRISVLLAIAIGLVVPAGVSAQAPIEKGQAALTPDPAVRRGVLPNGLHYAVMRNPTSLGATSVRLAIATGSVDETDDEVGAAHFVEHLAFGGADNSLSAKYETTFAAAGVAFGRDRNAQTTYHDTTYLIDLPRSDDAVLAVALQWLRTVADGVEISDASVNRERGVVLAERTAYLGPDLEAARAVAAFRAPDLRITTRYPIGTLASLKAMSPERLRAFY